MNVNRVLQGRYEILSLLGQGGMGAVYLARDLRFQNRYVALKENFDAAYARQFLQEAELLASLQHPHLPRVTDVFTTNEGRQYLVMDYVAGLTLTDYVAHQGVVSEADAVRWMEQVLDALAYLHAQSPPIIHRDVKPDNVRITPKGDAVLVDFGLVKFLVPGQATATVVRQAGSPGYAPIEQYAGGTDGRSDVYALGATFYFALTGQHPLESPRRAAGESMPRPRELNPAIPARLERVLLKALAVSAQERYQDTASMRRALHSGVLQTLVPVPAASPGRSWGKIPLIAAVVLVVGLGIWGIWSLLDDWRGPARSASTPAPPSPTVQIVATVLEATTLPGVATSTPRPTSTPTNTPTNTPMSRPPTSTPAPTRVQTVAPRLPEPTRAYEWPPTPGPTTSVPAPPPPPMPEPPTPEPPTPEPTTPEPPTPSPEV